MSCEFNSNDIKNGQDLNAQLLQSQLGPIETRLCLVEGSLQFLGNLFGKGVFNLDSQLTPGAAFLGTIISGGDEFQLDPGAAIIDGFIIQKELITTLSFFGLNVGTYYIQLDQNGLIDIYSSSSTERVALWKIEFDGIIQTVTDERIFITNPSVLFNELITARNTKATIVSTKVGPFDIITGVNDQLIISLDNKPNLEIIFTPNANKTVNQIVTEINDAFSNSLDYGNDYGQIATVDNNYIRVSSPGIGDNTNVFIQTALANETLGFLNNEQSIGITYAELEDRLNAQEIKIQTDLKQHISDTNIHHDKVHDINGPDHTGSLDESKVTFDPINGHNHDGINSKKIHFDDIDVTGVTNPFDVTLKQAEQSGIIIDGQPQLQQVTTANSAFVNDLVDPLLATTNLEDDLNQIRASIRQLKDPSQDFNTNPSQTLKDISDTLEHITNGDLPPLVPGTSIIPNTLSHNNLIAGGGVGNPHQTNLQDTYDASTNGTIQVTPTKPFIVGGSTPSTQVEINNLGEINGINLTNHVNDVNGHHNKVHSHTVADGSGPLDFTNLNYTGQLPLSSINDAQSATSFNIHNHDGINSPKINYDNLEGTLDLTGIVTTGQLPLDKIEGHNGSYFDFPLDVEINGNLILNGDFTSTSNTFTTNSLIINNDLEVKGNLTLGDNGSNINVNADNVNIIGTTLLTGDVSIGNDNSDSLTINATTEFTEPVTGVTPINPNHFATKDYVDNNIGGGGGTAAGISYDNSLSGLTANNVQDAINELNANQNNYLPLSGGTLTGPLILDANPTNAFEAATKQYVDNSISGGGVQKTGDTMTGNLVMSNQADIELGFLSKITSTAAGAEIVLSNGTSENTTSASQSIVRSLSNNYSVDMAADNTFSRISINKPGFPGGWTSFTHAGNSIRGGGFWSSNGIGSGINLSVNTGQTIDLQTDAGYAIRVNGSGSTNFITGGVTINPGNTISWTDVPTSGDHLTNKTYVDNEKVAKSGDTMSGFLTLNADPTLALHAATKQYVDSVAGMGTQFITTSNLTPSVIPVSSGTDNISLGSSAVSSTGINAISVGNSYASGNNSIAIHIGNNTSTYGAQGNYSVAIGQNNKAVNDNSIALGKDAVTSNDNQITHGLVRFNTSGDAQSSKYILGNLTTNNTTTSLYLDNTTATKKLILPNDSAWTYEIHVIGRTTSSSLQVGSYVFKGCITKQTLNSSVSIINQVKEIISESNLVWDVNVIADTSDGSLDIQVIGDIATNIQWVASVHTVETIFP